MNFEQLKEKVAEMKAKPFLYVTAGTSSWMIDELADLVAKKEMADEALKTISKCPHCASCRTLANVALGIEEI